MGRAAQVVLPALLAVAYYAGAAVSGEAAPAQPIHAGACPRREGVLSRDPPMDPIMVDDNSPPEHWAPWTHRPFCTVVPPPAAEGEPQEEDWDVDDPEENKEVNDELKDGVKYCTYTASYFGEYGVSVVARPVTGPYIAVLLKEAYDSSFPNPETVQNMNLESAIEIVDMPEKGGKGVIATRLIKAKETFLVDFATLAADLDLWGQFGKRAGAKLLHQGVERLLDPYNAAMSLSTSGAPGHAFPAAAVMWSNTFRSEIEGVPFTGLFPRISVSLGCRPKSMMCNADHWHSEDEPRVQLQVRTVTRKQGPALVPQANARLKSAVFRQSKNGLTAGVAAFRDIQPGEEITLSCPLLPHRFLPRPASANHTDQTYP